MLIKVGQKFETWMRKVLPDPLVIAIILTLIVGLRMCFGAILWKNAHQPHVYKAFGTRRKEV